VMTLVLLVAGVAVYWRGQRAISRSVVAGEVA
jgi:hypothetical protein